MFTTQKLMFILQVKFESFVDRVSFKKVGLGVYNLVADKR